MPEEQKTAETEQERLADFPRDLSRSFTYLHRQRKKYMDDRLRGYGFVGGMPMILLYINRHPGTTQDAIVSHMYIDKCTVARRTKRLEELGYISRETGKEDRRENNLYVTENGEKLLSRLTAKYNHERQESITSELIDASAANFRDYTYGGVFL